MNVTTASDIFLIEIVYCKFKKEKEELKTAKCKINVFIFLVLCKKMKKRIGGLDLYDMTGHGGNAAEMFKM